MNSQPDFLSDASPAQAPEPSPAEKWDRDSARRALDELFTVAHQYNSSEAYLELMMFVGKFRSYSPFNAMLVHTQMPGARFVATAHRWDRDFRRQIRAGARPIVILQPMGPVLFVFDVTDTEPLPDALPLPPWVEHPFEVYGGKVGREFEQTVENSKRDGVNVSERADGSQRAGSIQVANPGGYLEVTIVTRSQSLVQQVPRRYELLLNSNLSRESRYATLVHELGHLYCGHLGTPDPKWWPTRRGAPLEIREFEAESVCYLVCTRLGIENPSAEYLAGYIRNYESTPPISLDAVMKSSWLIEQMGRERLKLRTEAKK
jgi:IrrE N-terminal-like domain